MRTSINIILIIVLFFGCTPKYDGVFYDRNIYTYLDLSKNGNCYFQSGKGYSYGKYSFKNDSLILDFDDWKWSLPDSAYNYTPCSVDSIYFNITNGSNVDYHRLNIYIRETEQGQEFHRDETTLYVKDSIRYSVPFDASIWIAIVPDDNLSSEITIYKPGCHTINFYSPYPAMSKIGHKKLSYKVIDLKKDTIEILYHYFEKMDIGNRELIRLSDEENQKFSQRKPLKK